jgi:hypothetical protein
MATGPSPDLLNDPRFEAAVAKASKRQGLAPAYQDQVRQLVSGQADPHNFPCCNSGCRPCSKDYMRAAVEVIKVLDQPPAKPSLWRRLLRKDKG